MHVIPSAGFRRSFYGNALLHIFRKASTEFLSSLSLSAKEGIERQKAYLAFTTEFCNTKDRIDRNGAMRQI
jgi:hypothetical protein